MKTISLKAYEELIKRTAEKEVPFKRQKIDPTVQAYNLMVVKDILKDAQLVVTLTEYIELERQEKISERPSRDEEKDFPALEPKRILSNVAYITMTLKEMRELEGQLGNVKDEKSEKQIKKYLSKAQLVLTLREKSKLEKDEITVEEHKKIANAQYYITLKEMIALENRMKLSKNPSKELRNILTNSRLVVTVERMNEILRRKEPINNMLREGQRVENADLVIINDDEMNKWFPITLDEIYKVTEGVKGSEKMEAIIEETNINPDVAKGV